MKKWYRSIPVKAGLIGAAVVSAIVVSLSSVLILGNQGEGIVNSDNLMGFQENAYEESSAFEERMRDVSYNVMDGIVSKRSLEIMDGKYDPGRVVDIMEYYKNGKISGENVSGLSYKLGELVEWESGKNYADTTIVVCKKRDGAYYYYYLDEFEDLLQKGDLKLNAAFAEESESYYEEDLVQNVIQALEGGYSPMGYYGERIQILNPDGEMLYGDFWPFQPGIVETVKPVGAENVLEVVNKTPELNGELENVFVALESAVSNIPWDFEQYEVFEEMWAEGNTNFQYLFVDKEHKIVYTNNGAYEKFEQVEASIEKIKKAGKYVVVKPKLADFESNMHADASEWRGVPAAYGADGEYIFAAAVDTEYPVQDIFYVSAKEYGKYAPYLRNAGIFIILGGILLMVSLVWLTVIAGRRMNDEELHLNGFDRWKTGLGAAAVIIPWIGITWFLGANWTGLGYTSMPYKMNQYHAGYVYYTFSMTAADALVIVGYVGSTMILFLTGYLSLVRRIKGKTIWKNSVIVWVYRIFSKLWRHRSVCLRSLLLIGGFVLIHWLAILAGGNGFIMLLMFAAELGALYLTIRSAIDKDRIRKGIQEIASGNVNYQIPLEKVHGESREMAELVNGIGDGLNNAVGAAMKSERLKTDLITNVSHDIKTPLTSIINYVDLLKRENLDDPKIQRYLEVLEAKAQRLKTLTEDVVEASKVSSGNITLEMMDVNLVEMVNQTIGEFSEKMEAKNLTVVASLPEEPAIVHVDGRRMWRVLENIFNNAAKYAMTGTRVYADLRVKENGVEFSLKNISENPLNINAEELTERFIRGDVSRSTEGSGLGLSIARDLTEMQGGTFKLYLDGDLFKVIIEF